jgi:protein-disulfide isomerase
MPTGKFGKFSIYLFSTALLLLAIGISTFISNAGQRIETKPATTSGSINTVGKTAPQPHLKTESSSITNFGGREVSIGNPHAPLTIVMYYSLTCPHCHQYQEEELPKIQKEYIDKGLVRFVFRDFPTDSTAVKAAKIAWCHGVKQYVSFAKKLLETQSKWVPIDLAKEKQSDQAFHDIATKELGISDADFKKCMANENIESSILRQSFEAQRIYQIDAAPAFLINGKHTNEIVTTETIQKKLLEMGIHG